jgi:hypothetical protein
MEARFLDATTRTSFESATPPKYALVFNAQDFRVEYFNASSTLSIFIGSAGDPKYFVFNDDLLEYTSPDFNRLLNVSDSFFKELANMLKSNYDYPEYPADTVAPYRTDYYQAFVESHPEMSHTTIRFRNEERHLKQYTISFHNIWNRGEVLVKSSLTGLFNHQYLGFTNTQFAPIKLYPLDYTDQKFWVELYNMHNDDKIELPQNDLLYLETVIMVNTPLFI